MELPQSRNLTTEKLGNIFQHTASTYKFYWFISILDLYKKRGFTTIPHWNIMVEMVANAWCPVIIGNLSLGKVDSMRNAITTLQKAHYLSESIGQDELRVWLNDHKNDSSVIRTINFLPKNVPYRFLRPWIDTDDPHEVIRQSQTFANHCLYAIYKNDEDLSIRLNDEWLSYFDEYYLLLKNFAVEELIAFLQSRNPKRNDVEEVVSRSLNE